MAQIEVFYGMATDIIERGLRSTVPTPPKMLVDLIDLYRAARGLRDADPTAVDRAYNEVFTVLKRVEGWSDTRKGEDE